MRDLVKSLAVFPPPSPASTCGRSSRPTPPTVAQFQSDTSLANGEEERPRRPGAQALGRSVPKPSFDLIAGLVTVATSATPPLQDERGLEQVPFALSSPRGAEVPRALPGNLLLGTVGKRGDCVARPVDPIEGSAERYTCGEQEYLRRGQVVLVRLEQYDVPIVEKVQKFHNFPKTFHKRFSGSVWWLWLTLFSSTLLRWLVPSSCYTVGSLEWPGCTGLAFESNTLYTPVLVGPFHFHSLMPPALTPRQYRHQMIHTRENAYVKCSNVSPLPRPYHIHAAVELNYLHFHHLAPCNGSRLPHFSRPTALICSLRPPSMVLCRCEE